MADGELCGKAVATHPVVSVKSSTIEIHNGSRRVREFVAGGIAGCVAKGMVSPFDRIKILRQGEHRIHSNLSIIKSAQTIVRQEGTYRLYVIAFHLPTNFARFHAVMAWISLTRY